MKTSWTEQHISYLNVACKMCCIHVIVKAIFTNFWTTVNNYEIVVCNYAIVNLDWKQEVVVISVRMWQNWEILLFQQVMLPLIENIAGRSVFLSITTYYRSIIHQNMIFLKYNLDNMSNTSILPDAIMF